MNYKSGVITDTAYACSDKTKTVGSITYNINHAVTLVGYNTNSNTVGCTGYWIFKNSWGTSLNDKGYFKLCMASETSFPYGVCNMLSWISVPDVGLTPTTTNLFTSWE